MAQGNEREIRLLDSVDSTNRYARAWAREGAPHGAAVVARVQTAGRGRRGRDWTSAPDMGLWLSVVLRLPAQSPLWTLLPLAAALAAADAIEAVCGAAPAIKWPNDLLLGGKKIAGILAEREGGAAVLGIGINVAQRAEDFPLELRARAGSLRMQTGMDVDMAALRDALLRALDTRLARPDFLAEYARRCVTIGSRVEVVEVNGAYEAVAEGIAGDGALLVRDEAGAPRRVLAGDVSIRGAGGYGEGRA